MDFPRSFFRATLVLLCLGMPDSLAQAARDTSDSPLVEATTAFLETWTERRSADGNRAFRARALALADSLEAQEEFALASECLERAGILSYQFNEMNDAVEIWQRGLEVARRSGDDRRIAALLNAKANGVSRLGDNAAALVLQRELLGMRRAMGDVRGESFTLYNIALSQRALFQYPEAIESLRAALRTGSETADPLSRAMAASVLGTLLVNYDRLEEALALADSSVAICRRVERPYYLAATLNARAVTLNALGRYEESMRDLDQSLEEFEKGGFPDAGDIVRSNRVDTMIELGQVLESVAEARDMLRDFDEEGENTVLARAALGRALMRAGRLDEARSVLDEAVVRYAALRDTLTGDVARSDAVRLGGAVTYLALLHAREGRTDEAWRLVEDGRVRRDEDVVTLSVFQQTLAAHNAVALQFGHLSAEGCPVFLVTADTVAFHEIRDTVGLRRLATEFGDLLEAGSEGPRFARVRAELSEALLGPFRQWMDRGQRVIIAPGSFSGIAFEALDHGNGTDFGESFAISYTNSASRFVAVDARAPVSGGFVGFADATTDTTGGSGLWVERVRSVARIQLPESRVELRRVAPAGASLFLGSDATEAAFTSRARGARILHVATHALVDSGHPDTSALVLSRSGDDDGVVLARDIAELELANDLVCLSACATAGGYRSLGEGAFGLTRAFLESGARTVVSTWWDVEDRAARRFMELFYDGLRDELDRDEAARRARVAMAREGFSRRDRAAFAVTGAVTGSLASVLGVPSSLPRVAVLALVGSVVVLLLSLVRRSRSARTSLQ